MRREGINQCPIASDGLSQRGEVYIERRRELNNYIDAHFTPRVLKMVFAKPIHNSKLKVGKKLL
jgi:hypothetical protein